MKKITHRILCFALTVIMLLGVLPFASAAGDVAINSTNFPDSNFRAVVKTYDKNSDGKLSTTELGAVVRIDCVSKNIASLKGIEYFTALKTLYADYNNLTSVDLSKNTKLESVNFDFNQLTALDVTKLPALIRLSAWGNKITKLDVTKNPKLDSLGLGYNALTSLDISKNPVLTHLACGSNKLTALNITANPKMALLSCEGNSIKTLDLRKTPLLDKAYGKGTKDTSISGQIEYTLDTSSEYAVLSVSTKTVITSSYAGQRNPFTDVKAGKYYYNAVIWAYYHNPQITGGIGDGTKFGVNQSCTREQIVTFLWKACGSPAPKTTKNPFTDVKSGKYYYKAVLWAVEKGITSGTTSTKFGVGKACTREQIITFIWKAKGSPAPAKTTNPFKDVKSGKYYYKAILWAYWNNPRITGGVTDNEFGVGKNCTRAQVVTFLYAAYK